MTSECSHEDDPLCQHFLPVGGKLECQGATAVFYEQPHLCCGKIFKYALSACLLKCQSFSPLSVPFALYFLATSINFKFNNYILPLLMVKAPWLDIFSHIVPVSQFSLIQDGFQGSSRSWLQHKSHITKRILIHFKLVRLVIYPQQNMYAEKRL